MFQNYSPFPNTENVAHLRVLYEFDLENDPTGVYKSLDYFKPHFYYGVDLYRRALKVEFESRPLLLKRAKQAFRNRYKHLEYYFK